MSTIAASRLLPTLYCYSLTPGNGSVYKIASQCYEKVEEQTFMKQQNKCLRSYGQVVIRREAESSYMVESVVILHASVEYSIGVVG